MILVVKSVEAPAILKTTGKTLTSQNNKRYARSPKTYASKALPVTDGVYNDKTVKDALREAQHEKCCFCEKSQLNEDGAVEHFRPKRGFSATPKGKLQYPGYYWLCYNWINLYLICDACNRSKSNYFPLADDDKRAKSHRDDLVLEAAYILDPAGPEDPRAHLTFDRHFIKAGSQLGQKTIDACGLNQDKLLEERREFLKTVELLAEVYKVLVNDMAHKDLLQEVAARLNFFQGPTSMFSAAAADYLRMTGIALI